MGTGEENTPTKPSKPPSSTQEVPPTPSYPDWSSSMQAYYGAGGTAPHYFTSTVASPTPHPYMWGSQHPFISPYGTPVPYPAMYPPGGVYAHPGMTMSSGAAQPNRELEGKASNRKGQGSARKSKSTSATTGGKGGESGKATSGSGNDGQSHTAESGSEDSSEASDDPIQQHNFLKDPSKKGSFSLMLADGASAQSNAQASVTGKPLACLPPANLSIGMDLWNASSSAAGTSKIRSNPPGASTAIVPAGGNPDQWIQDERELKKQKRKQSNRESARRSRLRKQAECEELQRRVETLTNENHTLREELQKLSEDCVKITSENNSIKEELTKMYGPEAIADLEQSKPSTAHESQNGEGPSSC